MTSTRKIRDKEYSASRISAEIEGESLTAGTKDKPTIKIINNATGRNQGIIETPATAREIRSEPNPATAREIRAEPNPATTEDPAPTPNNGTGIKISNPNPDNNE